MSISLFFKQAVKQRANGFCEYCRSPECYSTQSFSIEHIMPVSKNGLTILENLALSCQGCNQHKFTKISGWDAIAEAEIPLFNPRLQDWNDHFTWSGELLEIIGLTPVGRVTVNVLKLNRKQLLNLRRALLAIGDHPGRFSQSAGVP